MKQKGFSSILLVIIIALVVGALVYYFRSYNNTPKQSSPRVEIISEGDLKVFKDNFYKVQFKYPSTVTLSYLESDGNGNSTNIYIAKNPSNKMQDQINYVIDCNKENRIDPIGVCVESITADLDIYIDNNVPASTSFKREETDKNCTKNESDNKTTYSCINSDLGGKEVYGYSIFLNSPEVKMSIDTRDKVVNQDLINTIIDSFQAQ